MQTTADHNKNGKQPALKETLAHGTDDANSHSLRAEGSTNSRSDHEQAATTTEAANDDAINADIAESRQYKQSEQQQQASSAAGMNGGRRVSWLSSEREGNSHVAARPLERASSTRSEDNTEASAVPMPVAAVSGLQQASADDSQRESDSLTGDHSTTSSLYDESLFIVGGGATGTGINGTLLPMSGGSGPGISSARSGTLSPQYTLVNSDGASMRVHTGSIRERNLNRRISAIHEDDSDAYPESRRSDSMLFMQALSPSSSQRRRYPLHSQPTSQPSQGQGHGQGQRRSRRMSEDDASMFTYGGTSADAPGMRLMAESDHLSMISGISEGGASTTRVRMATDLAYNALRIGPGENYPLFGYSGGHHRAMSFATSSDPGLPNTGSFYDYYLGPEGDPPNSGWTQDGHNNNRDSDSDADDGDIVSLIRSDIAVYGGAGDDVKFPFLPDNFSEFSGSIVYSPGGALSVDVERLSRDHSEFSYVSPAYHYQLQQQQAQQQQERQQQAQDFQNQQSQRYKPQTKLRKKGKNAVPNGDTAGRDRAVGSGSGSGNSASANVSPRQRWTRNLGPVSPKTPGPMYHRYSRRLRHQSASDTYHSASHAAAQVAAASRAVEAAAAAHAAAAAAVAAATSNGSAGSSSSPQSQGVRSHDSASAAAIRPNAIMRFFKRIAPKN
ncbi:hypothetical protein LPJ66_001144 [Kickxella alabastrina]|uniref:Uncharacterized protein n=1 Tax=Kickxella alabastrina TaxID=61397 RepID=A0ACC1IU25_9FUNG|nr:hypothetical protein LPJ66_001144 [Kickxella alabastrina]